VEVEADDESEALDCAMNNVCEMGFNVSHHVEEVQEDAKAD
jgi:hypothetical protein